MTEITKPNNGTNRRGGFTLIELMIVVAIIGILASIAISSFVRYGLRTKSAEVKSNRGAVLVVEDAIFSESGNDLAATGEPPVIPGATATTFDSQAPDFAVFGWAPEGLVYFSYAIAVSNEAAHQLVANLRILGLSQIMIYDDDDNLRIQALGSQPIRFL